MVTERSAASKNLLLIVINQYVLILLFEILQSRISTWPEIRPGHGKTLSWTRNSLRTVDVRSALWRLCIRISDRNVFPYGEMPVWPDGSLARLWQYLYRVLLVDRQARICLLEPAEQRCRIAAWNCGLYGAIKNNHYLRINIQDVEHHLFGRLSSEDTLI